MAEFSAVYTLTTPGPDITFNSGTDVYYLQNIQGLDGPAIRAPIDSRPQTHGGLVHPFLYGPRHMSIEGVLHVTSATTEAGYVGARNTMETNLLAALASIIRADGTLTWTPTGGTAKSLIVRHDVPCQFNGAWQKAFIFGLVAADPTIV